VKLFGEIVKSVNLLVQQTHSCIFIRFIQSSYTPLTVIFKDRVRGELHAFSK